MLAPVQAIEPFEMLWCMLMMFFMHVCPKKWSSVMAPKEDGSGLEPRPGPDDYCILPVDIVADFAFKIDEIFCHIPEFKYYSASRTLDYTE